MKAILLAAVLVALVVPASARGIAGCRDDRDLMWCLKLKANARWVDLPGHTMALRKNRAMLEYEKRLPRRKH